MPGRVNFLRHTEVFFVPSHQEMSAAERREAWYSAEERNVRLGADIRESVRKMRRQGKGKSPQLAAPGSDLNKCPAKGDVEGELCIRGLEHMRSSAHLEQRRINRDCVIQAVLEVQLLQKAEGRPFCPMEVSVASSSNSQWARNMATSFGESDAEYVQEYVRPAVRPVVQPPRPQPQTLEERLLQRRGEEGIRPRGAAEAGVAASALTASASMASSRSHRRGRSGRRSSALMKALEIVHNSHSSDEQTTSSSSTKTAPIALPSAGRTSPQSNPDRFSPSQSSTSSVTSISGSNLSPLQQISCDVNGVGAGTSAELLGHLSRMKAIAMRNGPPGQRPPLSSRHGKKRYSPDPATQIEGNPQQA